MKLKQEARSEQISGQTCAVLPAQNIKIPLTETAAFLFEELSAGERTKEQLLRALLKRFDISTVLALSEIDVFLKAMTESGLIEE